MAAIVLAACPDCSPHTLNVGLTIFGAVLAIVAVGGGIGYFTWWRRIRQARIERDTEQEHSPREESRPVR